MLHQYNTPPRIPQPSQTYGQNNGQLLHVILNQRQIEQQQRYLTPQSKREVLHPPPTISTTQNSPILSPNVAPPMYQQPYRVGVAQQINQQEMMSQYNQIMQYYKELDLAMQQQKQENTSKYNQIIYKIDNIQQMMAQNINQLNVNQRNEYAQLLNELQQQRVENEKRYELIFHNIAAQNQQQQYITQLQQKEQQLKLEFQKVQQEKLQHQGLQEQPNLFQQKPPLPNQLPQQLLPSQPVQQFVIPKAVPQPQQILQQIPGYQWQQFQPIQPIQALQDQQLSLEDQLFPEKREQLNYSQIHRQNKSTAPLIQVPEWGSRQQENGNNNSSYQTPFLQNSDHQNINQSPNKNTKDFSQHQQPNLPMSNEAIKRAKSPRDQQSPCICGRGSPNSSRDYSMQHKKKQIFDKPILEQINNKPKFQQHSPVQIEEQNKNQLDRNPHAQLLQTPIPFQADESILIEEGNNQAEILSNLKAEYGISSLSQTTALQYNVNQLQLIYCIFCDQYISLQIADSHLQGCSKARPMRRQNDNYLDIYINSRSNELFVDSIDSKSKRICSEINRIKQLMQLGLTQKWTTIEHVQLRDFCQIAIIIMDNILQNPNTYQLQKYYNHIQQIFSIVYVASQIFYKQQAQLLQKCLSRIKELQILYKK